MEPEDSPDGGEKAVGGAGTAGRERITLLRALPEYPSWHQSPYSRGGSLHYRVALYPVRR